MVFAILVCISLVALIVGLVKPSLVIRWGEKKTRFRVLLLYGAMVIVLTVLSSVFQTPEERAANARRAQIEQQQKAEKKIAEDKSKADKAIQEEADKERKAQEESAEKQKKEKEDAERSMKAIQSYKGGAQTINYKTLARNPEQYKGEIVVYTGRVVQVMESGNDLSMRVSIDDKGDNVFLINYRKLANEGRILEDDTLTFYGEFKGITKYKAVLGNEISVPEIKARYIERKN